ncbi:DUF4189 domain-containing protein [Nocardia sp. NPDC051030]|uniref:DUF4189 domain-containing protein n=1 Tax=Nocardia sp. NPDC051030 TaxID=3155162 RepID=UPI0034229771
MNKIRLGVAGSAVAALSLLPVASAQAATYYGAIAVAGSGAMGWAQNYPSEGAAMVAARNRCGYSDCQVLTTFYHCGAISYSPSANEYTGGRGNTVSEAESSSQWYWDSSVERWVCNS